MKINGIWFLLAAQIIVGIGIVISKLLLLSIPVYVLLPLRFVIASLILLPLYWITKNKNETIKLHLSKLTIRDWNFILAQSISAGILFNLLMTTGLYYTDANVAGIITSALPAMIAIMSWIILGETISANKAMCVAFATAGLLIITYSQLHSISASHSLVGDFIVLLALFPEAIYYILCKFYIAPLPIFLASSLLNSINAILLLPALFFVDWNMSGINGTNLLILFIIGIGTALFYVFWHIGSQKVDGVMASLSTAAMPATTVIFAWLILQEKLTYLEFIGMGLVVLSILRPILQK